jgi:hypothetical protein
MVTRKDIADACEWADVSQNQLEDTLAMGEWTADRVPWVSFWAFLVASVAGVGDSH